MRSPSLHIRREVLNDLIEDWFEKQNISKSSDALVEYLLSNGVRHTLTHRKKLDQYNDKTQKKTNQLVVSGVGDARAFAGLLKMARVQRKHRGIQVIAEGSRDWPLIKTCTANALEFCKDFHLKPREGMLNYINLFLDLTFNNFKGARFNLNALPLKHAQICNIYESVAELQEDKTPELTKKAHDIYCGKVSEKTGIPISHEKEPLQYIYFMYAAKLSKSFGITVGEFITSQFEMLDWTNGIPAPGQLVTKGAETRTVKWMAEHGIRKSNGKSANSMSKEDMKNFWLKVKEKNEDTSDE